MERLSKLLKVPNLEEIREHLVLTTMQCASGKALIFQELEVKPKMSPKSHVVFLRAAAVVLARNTVLEIKRQGSSTCFFAY